MNNILQRISDAYIRNPAEAYNLLPELIEQIKDGTVIDLPCKVGGTVYTVEEDVFNCEECPHGGEGYDGRSKCTYDGMCPLKIDEHICEGYEISGKDGIAIVSSPGEWGYEGLEHFFGKDGRCYFTHDKAESAEAALKEADQK